MTQAKPLPLSGTVVDERASLTLAELCRACGVHAEYVIELVAEGALEPRGRRPAQWRFSALCLRRTRRALHLQRDLHVNLAGAALALDLLEEVEALRRRLEAPDIL